jgi:hypothetical protein
LTGLPFEMPNVSYTWPLPNIMTLFKNIDLIIE